MSYDVPYIHCTKFSVYEDNSKEKTAIFTFITGWAFPLRGTCTIVSQFTISACASI